LQLPGLQQARTLGPDQPHAQRLRQAHVRDFGEHRAGARLAGRCLGLEHRQKRGQPGGRRDRLALQPKHVRQQLEGWLLAGVGEPKAAAQKPRSRTVSAQPHA
jgi:hypothetical protein